MNKNAEFELTLLINQDMIDLRSLDCLMTISISR